MNKILTRRKRRKNGNQMTYMLPRSNRKTRNGHAYQYKQRNDKIVNACIPQASDDQWRRIFKRKQTKNKPTRACIPRSERQTSNGDIYSNAFRRKTKLRVHGYLVLSVRQSMETHIQTKADEKQTYTCMYTSF